MRSAKNTENFPYRMSTVCYFEVFNNGEVKRVPPKNKSDINEVIEAHKHATENISTLYAVWPGNWSSDLFIIDDLDLFAEKFEIFSTVK